ncbi:type I glyceraldehyde-3-phosphate dehydrogenase [Pikeienuella sp. HZG-20]|uniref:type I glyceraldehyde-3-phosphate dehydrogenase n=1 Tax=Paludibacillus litoralis TaxID=3133267 RepID=UPI0030ED33E4
MAVRVAISGFGRIGRLVARTIIESGRSDVELVAVNNRGPVETAAHLFKYDSVHGRFGLPVKPDAEAGVIDLGRGPVAYTRHTDPRACEWAALDVDIVMECTGRFTARDDAALHLEAGAKRVLVSAPSKGADRTIVFGVNDDMLKAEDLIVSSASCTTNCLAPVAKVLLELAGIEQGFMTTIHAYTGDQPTLDATHKDLYRARAAATSLIPTKTGAAKAIGEVIPALRGVLDGVAMRAPVQNVSAVDLTYTAGRDVTVAEINDAMRAAADGPMKNVLGYTDEPLVSVDFNHDPRSAVFHTDQTRVLGGRFVRVLAWYDNEWGFSHRMTDLAAFMGAQMGRVKAQKAA